MKKFLEVLSRCFQRRKILAFLGTFIGHEILNSRGIDVKKPNKMETPLKKSRQKGFCPKINHVAGRLKNVKD